MGSTYSVDVAVQAYTVEVAAAAPAIDVTIVAPPSIDITLGAEQGPAVVAARPLVNDSGAQLVNDSGEVVAKG